jgi:hypothetical protein
VLEKDEAQGRAMVYRYGMKAFALVVIVPLLRVHDNSIRSWSCL